MMYRLLRVILFRFSAENAHHLTLTALRLMWRVPGVSILVRFFCARRFHKPVTKMGITFPNALGLAAGLDKNGEVFGPFADLGFGFVEIGTVTAKAQDGNPKPRLFRLPADRALINRMGFNNQGADAMLARVKNRRQDLILGINIGKTKVTPLENAADDYAYSTKRLAPFADYLVVNVSSPNTPGLRDLQQVEVLRPLLRAVRQAADDVCDRHLPLLVKIAPDLNDEDVDLIADLACELALDGMILTNTTIARAGLNTSASVVGAIGNGGLSGVPLQERSTSLLRRVRARVGDKLVLISCGGVDSASEAKARLEAGADLVQVYSALIFEGPSLIASICRAL